MPDGNGIGKIALLGMQDHHISNDITYKMIKGRYAIYVNQNMRHTIEQGDDIKPAFNDLIYMIFL
jgi:hypothetical protein